MKNFFFAILFLTVSISNAHALTLTSHEVARRTQKLTPKGKVIGLDAKIAKTDITLANSQYDPALTANVSYTKDETKRSSTLFGTSTTQTQFNAGLSQLTPLGTRFQFGFVNTRESNNSAFFNPNTYYDSRLTSQLTQPLLQNTFGYNTRKNVAFYKTLLKATQEGSVAKLNELTYQNLVLYWNWYLARHLVNIHEQAVLLARRLYHTNTEKLEIGLIEKPDLHAFAANLNLKMSNLTALKNQVSQTENGLKATLDLTDTSLIVPGAENLAKDQPESLIKITARALNHHPALLALRQDLKAHNIRVAIQKNTKLPQLDLVASLASNGIDSGYGTAASDIANINPVWSAGVNFSLPILNRAARGEYKKQRLIRQQKLHQLKDLENQVITGLSFSFDRYQNALQNLKLTGDAVFNQKMKWDGEVRRYQQGRSDPDLVIRYQDDYLNAKAAHLQAKVEVGLAGLELKYAQGKL